MNKGLIREYESLTAYCTYRTGGRARYLALPEKLNELMDVLVWADAMKLPHELIGHGANLLFSDAGYEGLIVCLKSFERFCVRKDDRIFAGAGTPLMELVRYTAKEKLAGFVSLAGIPGTVGGAIKMNAGAFGTEMKDLTLRVNILENTDEGLKTRLMEASEAEFGYRQSSGLLAKIVLSAEFKLEELDCDFDAEISDILKKRAAKQPLNFPSCGSVFKRPEGYFAGALIEGCGLKGLRIGGAKVSEKHANFIVNTGEATSDDIYRLILYVKLEVLRQTGVLLEEEVRYIGNFRQQK